MSPAPKSPIDRNVAGFTIIEVLIALAVVAGSMMAIGSVMSTNARSVRALEDHLALMQTAQTVLATAIPPRKDISPGSLSGRLRDYRWLVDVSPLGDGWEADDQRVAWIPERIRIRVRAASGATVDIETVRLIPRPQHRT